MTRIKTREKTVKRLMTASAAAGPFLEEETLPIIEIRTAHFQILGTNLNTYTATCENILFNQGKV